MSAHESHSNVDQIISPQLALIMIEEGFAISANEHVYQRNPGLNYFNFRKWRQSEDYTIQNQNRNKIYLIHSHNEYTIYTREEVLERIKNADIKVIPPKGHCYKSSQLHQIYTDMRKILWTINSFIN